MCPMMINFQEITPEAIAESWRLHHAEIHAITICHCGLKNYHHRLGCKCGKTIENGVEWAFQHNNDILRTEKDFNFIPWQYK